MTDSWVVDSSIGVAWAHPAQASSDADTLLASIRAGTKMVIPTLWYPEVANVLMVLQRRNKLSSDTRAAALAFLDSFEFIIDDESIRAALRKTSDLAEKYDLTVYDATYLEVALRRNLPLASRDRELNNAARQCGIKTL